MEIRRLLILMAYGLAVVWSAFGQVAVKTNVAMDAVAVPNLGAEVGLGKQLTLDVPVYYNPWESVAWKHDDGKLFKLLMVQPELRWWLCDKFNGHFFGVHGMAGAYNTTGIDLPFSPFDDLDSFRYKGHFYGAGISYGYQYILGRHWSLEGTLGLGWAHVRYKKYPCEDCAEMKEKGTENYLGPTRAALSLIYVF